MASSISYQEKPRLKYYNKGLPENIDYENISLPDIDFTACKYPKELPLIFMQIEINSARFKYLHDDCIACVDEIELRKGNFVMNFLSNVFPTVVSFYATLKIDTIKLRLFILKIKFLNMCRILSLIKLAKKSKLV